MGIPRAVRWTFRSLGVWLVLSGLRNAFWPDLAVAPLSNRFVHVGVLTVAGVLAWTAGEGYYAAVLWTVDDVPLPSPADAGFLLAPPLLLAGLLLVARGRSGRLSPTALADALVAALATGAVSAALVVDQVRASAPTDPVGVATTLAYPLSDLVLLAVVVGAVAGTGWRPSSGWTAAGLGVAMFWVADSLYLVKTAAGTFVSPSWFDVGWWAGLTLVSAAAWLPAPAREARRAEPGQRLIVMPLAFGLVGLGLLLLAAFGHLNELAVTLAALSIVAVMARLLLTFRANLAMLATSRQEALDDALTGLPNRRALERALESGLHQARPERPLVLALFDLDGFKAYNDAFGHPAGDALLARLGAALARYLRGRGTAFRMGGDEFCALFEPGEQVVEPIVAGAAQALSEQGDGFAVTCSHGSILLPLEAADPAEALRIVDQRMYAHKHAGRASTSRQTKDVLPRVLAERDPQLDDHLHDVAAGAERVARRLGLSDAEVEETVHTAELHDVGKVAVPDAILSKPGSLDEEEWTFIRRHTLIGERIVAAAPALQRVARAVRSTHERWDGGGYPDGIAGAAIPMAARIVAVADAFDAMIAERPYSDGMPPASAVAELRRCAGTQFDAVVVEAFCADWLATEAGEGARAG